MKKYQLPLLLIAAGAFVLFLSQRAKAATPALPQTSTVPGVVGSPFAVGRTPAQIPANITGTVWVDPATGNEWRKAPNGTWMQY
jgi:hypothetical protein